MKSTKLQLIVWLDHYDNPKPIEHEEIELELWPQHSVGWVVKEDKNLVQLAQTIQDEHLETPEKSLDAVVILKSCILKRKNLS